jgi:hypothetical protein
MPTVPAVLPAVKVTAAPARGLIVPRTVLDRLHTYAILEGGHVALHVGVAMKTWAPSEATVGIVGLTATEVRVTAVMVITVEVILVIPLSVALTKIPMVPAVAPAV